MPADRRRLPEIKPLRDFQRSRDSLKIKGFLSNRTDIISLVEAERSILMCKAISGVSVIKTLAAAIGLVFVGYVVVAVLPGVRRYIRISTM